MLWIATFLANFRLIQNNNGLKNNLIRQMIFSVRELYFHVGENIPGPADMMPIKTTLSMWLGILHLEYHAFRVKWAMEENMHYTMEMCDCAICHPTQNAIYWNNMQQHIGEGCFCVAVNQANPIPVPEPEAEPEQEQEQEQEQEPIPRSPPYAPPPTECSISYRTTPEVPEIITHVGADAANVIDLYPYNEPLPSTSRVLQTPTPTPTPSEYPSPARSLSPFDMDDSPYVMERSEDGLRLVIRRNRN